MNHFETFYYRYSLNISNKQNFGISINKIYCCLYKNTR